MSAEKLAVRLPFICLMLSAYITFVPSTQAQMTPKNLAENGTMQNWWDSDAALRLKAATEIIRKATGKTDPDAAMALVNCITDATKGNSSFRSSKVVDIALSCEGG